MSDDFPGGENIVFRAAANVVNDKRPALRVGSVRDDSRVIQAVVELPIDDVAGLPLISNTRIDGVAQGSSVAPQKSRLVGDAPLVNVGVGAAAAPFRGISARTAFFVLVNQLLQVISDGAQGANDHVGASAPATRDIAVRVIQRNIGCVIKIADLGSCRQNDLLRARCAWCALARNILIVGPIVGRNAIVGRNRRDIHSGLGNWCLNNGSFGARCQDAQRCRCNNRSRSDGIEYSMWRKKLLKTGQNVTPFHRSG